MSKEQTAGKANMEQRPVATCSYCEREMGKQECLYDHVVINGEEYERVRVVSLRDALGITEETPARGIVIPEEELDEPCCECGCEIGEVHHVMCDLEECPRCGGQFLSCLMDGENYRGCNVEEFFYFSKQEQK